MNQSRVWIFFTLLALSLREIFAIADLNKKPTKCTEERAYKMKGYNCARLDLNEIPKYLKKSTEVSIEYCVCCAYERLNAKKRYASPQAHRSELNL
jgi:hypothetical protein